MSITRTRQRMYCIIIALTMSASIASPYASANNSKTKVPLFLGETNINRMIEACKPTTDGNHQKPIPISQKCKKEIEQVRNAVFLLRTPNKFAAVFLAVPAVTGSQLVFISATVIVLAYHSCKFYCNDQQIKGILNTQIQNIRIDKKIASRFEKVFISAYKVVISEYNAVKSGYRDITRIIKKVVKDIEEKIPGIVFSSEENTVTSSNQLSISTQSSRQCRNSNQSNEVDPEEVKRNAIEVIERLMEIEKRSFKKLDQNTRNSLEEGFLLNFIKFVLDIYQDAIDGIIHNTNKGVDPCEQLEDVIYEYLFFKEKLLKTGSRNIKYFRHGKRTVPHGEVRAREIGEKYSKHQFSKDDLPVLRYLLKDNKSLRRIVDVITEYFQTKK